MNALTITLFTYQREREYVGRAVGKSEQEKIVCKCQCVSGTTCTFYNASFQAGICRHVGISSYDSK